MTCGCMVAVVVGCEQFVQEFFVVVVSCLLLLFCPATATRPPLFLAVVVLGTKALGLATLSWMYNGTHVECNMTLAQSGVW